MWHGSSVPEIFDRGDFLHPVAWDYLCPERTILPGSNRYCGKVIFASFSLSLLCWPRFSLLLFCLFVCLCFNILTWLIGFCCFSVLFLIFLFQMCSSQRCGANSLPLSLIICSHWLAASRKQCLHRKRKAPFVLIWLVLSAGSFGLCLTVFATCLPISSTLRPTYSAWILKQILRPSPVLNVVYSIDWAKRLVDRSAEGLWSSYRFFHG